MNSHKHTLDLFSKKNKAMTTEQMAANEKLLHPKLHEWWARVRARARTHTGWMVGFLCGGFNTNRIEMVHKMKLTSRWQFSAQRFLCMRFMHTCFEFVHTFVLFGSDSESVCNIWCAGDFCLHSFTRCFFFFLLLFLCAECIYARDVCFLLPLYIVHF